MSSRSGGLKNSPEYVAALEALRRLEATDGYDALRYVMAEIFGDDRKRFAEQNGLKQIDHTHRSVGRILRGIPDALGERAREQWRQYFGGRYSPPETEVRQHARDMRQKRIWSLGRWSDHIEMFAKSGKPYAIVGHPYQLLLDDLKEIVDIAEMWDLDVYIDGRSWYFAGWTVRVVLHRRVRPVECIWKPA